MIAFLIPSQTELATDLMALHALETVFLIPFIASDINGFNGIPNGTNRIFDAIKHGFYTVQTGRHNDELKYHLS
ncbi:hypothetical protein [Listeria swaminathanii]|uniref:Uncharacterized protein n=1 Tax=Listeria swaminathanii TaxID=2713501 RepID=A0A7X0ZYM0_9LIST|nr:hypothetical protein [Listeria swaminathanii]MBC2328804.1 hypothetical protein [Listeria swaminathanii]